MYDRALAGKELKVVLGPDHLDQRDQILLVVRLNALRIPPALHNFHRQDSTFQFDI